MDTWIDSHAHVFSSKFEEDVEEMIERAEQSGIKKILMPNIDVETIESMHNLALKYPAMCFAMMGLHPCNVKEDYKVQLDKMYQLLKAGELKEQYVAIGEVGTDLYWDNSYWEAQKEALKMQTAWSFEFDLPLVIHCRSSIRETIDLFKSWKETEGYPDYKGVFHCFTGTLEEAKEVIALGFYLGIGGVLTFKNGGIREWMSQIPKDKIVVETDSPYLAPTPNRGKRNEPSFIPLVGQVLAEEWGMTLGQVAKITTMNSLRLFEKVEKLKHL